MQELQCLMGMLNYSSGHIPDYKRIAKPLIDLMGSKGGGRWKQCHTDALNILGELVWQRMKLSLVDMDKPAQIFVDVDDTHCSAVLS